jgi:hypothetical protein
LQDAIHAAGGGNALTPVLQGDLRLRYRREAYPHVTPHF